MANKFLTDAQKYQALKDRNPHAEGVFVYCVKTTNIVCRPTCSSRLALAKNVTFRPDVESAIRDGFVPCRRCKPELSTGWNKPREIVIAACQYLAANCHHQVLLVNISSMFGLSKWHFLRMFRNYVKMTPKEFQNACIKYGTNKALVTIPLIETKKNLAKQKLQQRPQSKTFSPDLLPLTPAEEPLRTPIETQQFEDLPNETFYPLDTTCGELSMTSESSLGQLAGSEVSSDGNSLLAKQLEDFWTQYCKYESFEQDFLKGELSLDL